MTAAATLPTARTPETAGAGVPGARRERRWPIALRRDGSGRRPVAGAGGSAGSRADARLAGPASPGSESGVGPVSDEVAMQAGRLAAAGGQSDSLRIYLHDINDAPLLAAEDEVELAQQMEAGREARELLESEAAPASQRAALKRTADLGMAARDRLIRSNLRLVVATARRHVTSGADLGDLIQEGNLGLIKAVERYNWRLGNRFSTYALWWIRQAISTAAFDSTRSVRLPTHVVDSLSRLSRTEQRLAQEMGRAPTDGEICEAVGISETKLADLKSVRERPSSLDVVVGEEGDCELGDLIEDTSGPTPLAVVVGGTLRQEVVRALETLTLRERQVIWLRFGLGDDHTRTLEEVGRALQITKERVRQIEGRALIKLRQAPRARWLAEFAQ